MNIVVNLTIKVRIVELTSLKGLKVSPFNESENSKGVKVFD